MELTGCDSRNFCVGVRIVKRRTLHQILSLISKEAEGESFEDALTRVRKCIGGGATTENAVSDSDIEIVADFIPVNLRCPMSGLRLKVKLCAHMGCFDLEVFMEMNQRSRKWQCPICLKNYSWETIIIDPYFNRITSKLHNSGDEEAEIEVKPDGSWRVKAEFDRRRGLGDLVNQDGIEYESKSLIIDLPPGFSDPARDAVVIVLSDSEEETEPLVSNEAIYNNVAPATSRIRSSASQNRTVDSYYENAALVTGVHLYNPNDDDEFGSSMWSLPSGGEGVPSLPTFGSDVDISDPSVDVHPATISLGMNDSGTCKTSRVRPDCPSSFPHQERSKAISVYQF